jgi:hypothetical protein
MTRKGRAARATVPGVWRRSQHPRKLPAQAGMPVPVGVEHRKAPERLPEAARTPWELRVSRRPAGSRTGEMPWGAGPMRRGVRESARPGAEDESARGNQRRRKPLRRFGNDVLRRGVRRLWDHGRGTRAERLKRLQACGAFSPRIPQSSRLTSTVVERTQRVQRCTTAPSLERASRARTPGAAADPASPRGRRESNPSRG